ncbi:hypothetical protein D3C86_1353750 [compost metagenome]
MNAIRTVEFDPAREGIMRLDRALHDISQIRLTPIALKKQGVAFGQSAYAGHQPFLIILDRGAAFRRSADDRYDHRHRILDTMA